MHLIFSNRLEAGRLLAEKLASYAGRAGLLVLALPRGGVPVAAEVARALDALFDVLVVRKIGAPGNPELAIGAIASGGLRVLNSRVLESLGLRREVFNDLAAREQAELARRERAYRGNRPAFELRDRTVILVDDGIATGSTMRAAVAVVRDARAGRVVVATPVAARESYLELRSGVSEFVTLLMPRYFGSVGEFYADFTQTTDAEVRHLLSRALRETIAVT